jgi:hypothetical protein
MKSQSRIKIKYCSPHDIQYTFLQDVKFVKAPERTRAINIPSIKPDVTMESAAARLFGGARSPTRGSISWGVTVDTATRKETVEKTASDFVVHSTILRNQPLSTSR